MKYNFLKEVWYDFKKYSSLCNELHARISLVNTILLNELQYHNVYLETYDLVVFNYFFSLKNPYKEGKYIPLDDEPFIKGVEF